jgi:energy-coupling factor transport system permease protein
MSASRVTADLTARFRIPRALHPGAWWLWSLGMATAASRTTNPLLLLLTVAVCGYVVTRRRGDAPWALAFRMYLLLGAFVVVMRVVFRIVFGGGQGETVLFTLPQIPLPEWTAGIRLFGPVAAEQLLSGLYDGLRLATMLVCVGAANALANPKRMLKALPGALYEIGTSVVVALSVAPQLVESVQRIRRARRLRGGAQRGMRALRGILIPVLEDALTRSLALAAAMASHGYGRTGRTAPAARLVTGFLVLTGLLGVCVGLYGVMDSSVPAYLGAPALLAGLAVATAGLLLGGRRVRRSRYRPDRWRTAELLTVAAGITAGALMYATTKVDPADLYPSLSPMTWPALGVLPALAVLTGLLPAWLTPPPALTPPQAADLDQAKPTPTRPAAEDSARRETSKESIS